MKIDIFINLDRSYRKKYRRANANDPFRVGFGRGREREIGAFCLFEKFCGIRGRRFANEVQKARKNFIKFAFVPAVFGLMSREALVVRIGEGIRKVMEQDAEAVGVMAGAEPERKLFFQILFDNGRRMRQAVTDPTTTFAEAAQIGEKQKVGQDVAEQEEFAAKKMGFQFPRFGNERATEL